MKMMICDYAEKCDIRECPCHKRHEPYQSCTLVCGKYPSAKCILYVDPIIKRIQERFAEWADAKIDETCILLSATVNLDRIIQEESNQQNEK